MVLSSHLYLPSRVSPLNFQPCEAFRNFATWSSVTASESFMSMVIATDYGRNPTLFQDCANFTIMLRWKWGYFHHHLALDNSPACDNKLNILKFSFSAT